MDKDLERKLIRLAGKLGIHGGRDIDVAPFICREDGNEYEAWLLRAGEERYVLKKAKGLETECYRSFFSEKKPYAPAFLGLAEDDGKKFILIEYCPGEELDLNDREMLRKALDALIGMQDDFWLREDLYGSAVTIERALKAVEDRGRYLGSELLDRAYAGFTELYVQTPRTLCHEDLLPINVLVGDRAVLIDWEYGGILPYLSSFARLIAHGRDESGAYFFMREENRDFAVEYYYDRFAAKHGIAYEKYRCDLDHFLFYEYCEWVMLGNRYDSRSDERYGYYLKKAEDMAGKILKEG